MLNLTTQHIDQIRNYFLATAEEEKFVLQRSITPTFLRGFLNDLKELFIYHPNDENKLSSIAKKMGAGEHIEALKEIQHEYYSHLASIFNMEESNTDIELLLKIKNPLFVKEISYQMDIQKAFRLDAREELKKIFRNIETHDDIQNEEMFKAFRLVERQKLKEEFEALEVPELSMTGSELVYDDSSISFEEEDATKPASKKILNWRRLAFAACIIGILALTGYLFILRDGKPGKSDMANNKENEIILFGRENNLSENSKFYEVNERGPSDFPNTATADSIKVVVRDVKSINDLIEFKKTFLVSETDSLNSQDDIVNDKHHVLDSLNSLQEYLLSLFNTYTYSPEKKTIILNVSNIDSVNSIYRYSKAPKLQTIYLQLNSIYYKIKPVNYPLDLEPVTNNEVIKELEKNQYHK